MGEPEQEVQEVEEPREPVEDGEVPRRGAAGQTGAQADAHAESDGREAAEIEGDLDELVAKARQRDEYLALAQRTQADFENYRKRVARDLAAAGERGMASLVKELLPALDNLERALEAAASHDPLLAGVKLVHAELNAALARVGIEQFAPLGEQFDPNEHEAMAQQPVEGVESGRVAEVFQNGYRLKGSVIRPARVLVAA
jgi:molecular chaperone GrpE